MKRLLVVIAILTFSLSSTIAQDTGRQPGPFGFEKGMTREQILKVVHELKQLQVDAWEAKTAPNPHPAFESYWLMISPKDGLLKVVAVGKTIPTGDTGSQLQNSFEDIVSAISQKYGKPAHAFDYCTGNDTECHNTQFWMMSLKNKNRVLSTSWHVENGVGNFVKDIGVQAQALSYNNGYVNVMFEFEGFGEYADSKKNQQNAVF